MPDVPAPTVIDPVLTDQSLKDRSRITLTLGLARTLCDQWHKDIERSRKLYEFNHFDYRPKPGETTYADPTYTNTVDLAVGVLLGEDIDFDVRGWTPSMAEEEASSKVEKYLAGVLAVNSRRNDYHIPYEVILHFVRDGAGVLYSVWDPDIAAASLANVPMAGPDGMVNIPTYLDVPIRTQVIDPIEMFAVPGGRGRYAKMFRVERMSVYDVETLYNVRLKKFAGLTDDAKLITYGNFIDFWEVVAKPHFTPGDPLEAWYRNRPYAMQNAMLFDEEFLMAPRLMPGYGDYPYTLGFFKPVKRDKPEGWGHSIIRPMETTVAMLERSVNRRSRQIDIYSSLPIVSRTLPGRAVSVDPGMGTHVNLGPNEDIGFPNWPGNAPDVEQQIEFLRSRVQQSGFSDVMFGSGASQVSGFAINQLGDQNRIRLTQPTTHLGQFFTRWADKTIDMTRSFAGDRAIRVYGHVRGANFAEAVRGTDLEGYQVNAVVHPVFPNEEARRHAMATQVKGILPARIIIQKYLGVRQPDEAMKMLMEEQVLNHPAMQQYILITALREMAAAGDVGAQIALQAMLNGQASGMPGRPTEPNAPEQPLGLSSSTGLPTPQEQGGMPPGQSPQDQLVQQATATPDMTGVIG